MKIKEFCSVRMGYAFRKRLEHVPGGGVKIIQPKNISAEGDLIFDEGEPLKTTMASPKPLIPGDVLLVNRGRFAAAVFNLDNPGPWIVPSSILILSLKEHIARPEYISLFFNSSNGQKLFHRHLEKTTIPFISTSNLANMDIPIPPPKTQSVLIELDSLNRRFARLVNRKLELQKQILSHELMMADRSIKRRSR